MEVRLRWEFLDSNALPRDRGQTEKDLRAVAEAVASNLQKSSEEKVDVDLKMLYPLGVMSGKMLEGVVENVSAYGMRWAGKLFSGDVSAVLGETITYAVLDAKFKVDVSSLVPLRLVKYLGVVPDLVVPLADYKELRGFLGAKGDEMLLVNSRSMVTFSYPTLVKNLMRDLSVTEVLRYPDNFSLLSYVTYDDGVKDLIVVVRP